MLQFFKSDDETLWPVSEIERVDIVRNQNGRGYEHYAYLKNGTKVRMSAGEAELLRRQSAPIFSASDGYFMLHVLFESEGNDPVLKTPIVAWCHCPDEGLVPITMDGINHGMSGRYPILHPNGQVSRFEDGILESVDALIEELRPKGKK